MNLYFQFFTHNQSEALIDLIQLPMFLTSTRNVGGKVKISAAGKVSYSSFSTIEALARKVRKKRLNEVEVIYDVKTLQIKGKTLGVDGLNGVLYPSTTCGLWFPSKDFPLSESRRGRQRKMNAKTQEGAGAYYGVALEPSVFEVALDIQSTGLANQFLDCCAELLVKNVSSKFGGLELFGCCDVGGKEFFVRLESHVLMLDKFRIMARIRPSAYSELGNKFDDLHPIMFGAKKVCSGLAGVLGTDAKLICEADASDFAVIHLCPECDVNAARERAKDWLLPRIR